MFVDSKYPFIFIISLLNQKNTYQFAELQQASGLSQTNLLQQLKMIQQLFCKHIRYSDTLVELLMPIALFSPSDFYDFNDMHVLQVQVVNTCVSTNTLLLQYIRQGNKNYNHQVIIANEQLAGRGRQTNHWQSELGKSLTFSLAWQVDNKTNIQTVPLVMAVAVAKALREFVPEIQIKWPNDLVVAQRKLGGILVESVKYQDSKMLVIGVGLNFASFSYGSINNVALLELNKLINPIHLVSRLLSRLEQALVNYLQSGFRNFQQEFNAWHRDANKKVRLTFKNKVILEGMVQEVVDDGTLVILDNRQQSHQVSTSDFSLTVLE